MKDEQTKFNKNYLFDELDMVKLRIKQTKDKDTLKELKGYKRLLQKTIKSNAYT